MKTIGIVAHSAEGGALCFLTACREGAVHLGPHMHPTIVVSAVPMGMSMEGWEKGDYKAVADAGADFYVCPDNTAYVVLEQIAAHGWKHVGLLGTNGTMTGPVYAKALETRGLARSIPEESMREKLHDAIFDELRSNGAECVILGCTEIPLIVTPDDSSLPVLDSTRLLAKHAVLKALNERPVAIRSGWLG